MDASDFLTGQTAFSEYQNFRKHYRAVLEVSLGILNADTYKYWTASDFWSITWFNNNVIKILHSFKSRDRFIEAYSLCKKNKQDQYDMLQDV